MKVVAWRGNSHKYLENTIKAVEFTPAWVSMIELDTRLTSDGVMVAYHSPTMRCHGDDRKVSEISSSEIFEKTIESKRDWYQVPSVLDILTKFPTREFMFHIKRETDIPQYVDEVSKFPFPCYFHSNSEDHLKALVGHKNNRGLFKSVYTPADEILDYVHGYMLGHKAFMPVSALEEPWLKSLREQNKEIIVFASMSEEWMDEVLEYDVDGFLTGRFDRALSALEFAGIKL